MPVNDKERRDPLKGVEPAEELGLTSSLPPSLVAPPAGDDSGPPPSVKRRRRRQVSVTFSDADIPERLRKLALEWGLVGPDKRSPAVSTLIETLLLPQLEAAENGSLTLSEARGEGKRESRT